MCETLLITLIIPTFICEGNALTQGSLDFYRIVDLGPINFLYIILYISWAELLNKNDIKGKLKATGTEFRFELNHIFGK